MGQTNLPDYKQKQKLLFKEGADPATLIQQGEQFFAAGWYKDAVDFFGRAEFTEGLERVRAKALDEGDAFLLLLSLRTLGIEAEAAEWRQLADRALALGKLQFAREGYRLAGDRKGLDKVDALIGTSEPTPDDAGQEETSDEEQA
jgi:hypothetical protein